MGKHDGDDRPAEAWRSPAQAQSEIRTLGAQSSREHPERNSFEGYVAPLTDHVNGRMRPALWVFAGAVGVVMLIVCANLSNLLLARTASRQKEIAIRTALGASRRRLIAQMLTEGIVLSSSGAALGLLLAIGGTRALAHLDAMNVPLLPRAHVDPATLGFTLAVAILTGIVFGLAPAFQTPEAMLHDALKDASRGSTGSRRARGCATRWSCPRSRSPASCWSARACCCAASFACSTSTGVPPVARDDHSCGSRHVVFHARATDRVFRRGAAPDPRDPGVEGAGITDALPSGATGRGAPARKV